MGNPQNLEPMLENQQYQLQEVEFYNGAVKISGTLALPAKAELCPAIVLVHGSGPEPRKFNLETAKDLARKGVAALAYDKRGVGLSGGNWMQGDYSDLAKDAIAGVEFLHQHPAINPAKVGVLGSSEGGWVIGLAASLSDSVAFSIFVSAAGMTPALQENFRRTNMLREKGYPALFVKIGGWRWRILCAYCRLGAKFRFLPLLDVGKFFSLTLDYDPIPVLQKLTIPVLALWGEADKHLSASKSAQMFEDALNQAGNSDYTLKLYPGADHFLNVEGVQVPDKVETIVSWVLAH